MRLSVRNSGRYSYIVFASETVVFDDYGKPAEKKENKQLKRIMEFADNNNLIPMKVFRRGIFGRRLRDEVFYKAIRYMRAGKADALIVTNLDAISDGIADSYLKIGAVREAGYRLFSVDEKEPKVDLYIPPKRGDLQ